MASFKFKNALGVERGCADGFGGIDRSIRKSSDTSELLFNLDLNADGSLTTRSGYREILSMSAPIRAVRSEGKKFYCLAGSDLSQINTESGETVSLGTVETEEGDGEIFFFGGELFVHDSKKLYCLKVDQLVEVDGYAPLYGKEWHPSLRGAVNEDLNLASDRVRISYLTADSAKIFDLGLEVESIDRVEINGEIKNIESLGVVLTENKADFTKNVGLASGMIVTFWLTLKKSVSKRNELAKSIRSFVFSNGSGERLCIYSPDGEPKLFCSQIPSAQGLFESRKTAPDSSSLYISSALRIGNGFSPITGMAHHKDRALLFTDSDTWCVDFEGKESDHNYLAPKIFLLNSAIGSEVGATFAYCENDPISYYRGKLFRWHSQSGVRDECSTDLISEPVAGLIPKDSESIAMLSVPHMNLLLISEGSDIEGRMLVYNTELKSFTLYGGIFAEKLFTYASVPAFSRGERIYLLCGGEEKDIDDGEESKIKSKLISHFLDFGCSEKVKRSISLMINGKLEDKLLISFENESGEKVSFTVYPKNDAISEKFNLPRFKKLRYTIESHSRIRLENIILSAK